METYVNPQLRLTNQHTYIIKSEEQNQTEPLNSDNKYPVALKIPSTVLNRYIPYANKNRVCLDHSLIKRPFTKTGRRLNKGELLCWGVLSEVSLCEHGFIAGWSLVGLRRWFLTPSRESCVVRLRPSRGSWLTRRSRGYWPNQEF